MAQFLNGTIFRREIFSCDKTEKGERKCLGMEVAGMNLIVALEFSVELAIILKIHSKRVENLVQCNYR